MKLVAFKPIRVHLSSCIRFPKKRDSKLSVKILRSWATALNPTLRHLKYGTSLRLDQTGMICFGHGQNNNLKNQRLSTITLPPNLRLKYLKWQLRLVKTDMEWNIKGQRQLLVLTEKHMIKWSVLQVATTRHMILNYPVLVTTSLCSNLNSISIRWGLRQIRPVSHLFIKLYSF